MSPDTASEHLKEKLKYFKILRETHVADDTTKYPQALTKYRTAEYEIAEEKERIGKQKEDLRALEETLRHRRVWASVALRICNLRLR